MSTRPDSAPGPPIWLGIVLLAAGIIAVLIPIGDAILRVSHAFTTSSITTPAAVQRHLDSGRWIIFEQTGSRAGVGGFTIGQNNGTDLEPGLVQVTGPAGEVPVTFPSTTETITRGSRIYTGALQFRAPQAGEYVIRLRTFGARTVLISRPLAETFRGFAPLVAIGGTGGLLLIAGIVVLIIGGVMRSRARRVPTAFGAPPFAQATQPAAGWYPDPEAPGQMRWWDGYRWAPRPP